MGDLRRLPTDLSDQIVPKVLEQLLNNLKEEPKYNWILVDCRGGIDLDSIAVCKVVDDIIVIVEPDTTSFLATQHVADVLSNYRLSHKLNGSIINNASIGTT